MVGHEWKSQKYGCDNRIGEILHQKQQLITVESEQPNEFLQSIRKETLERVLITLYRSKL